MSWRLGTRISTCPTNFQTPNAGRELDWGWTVMLLNCVSCAWPDWSLKELLPKFSPRTKSLELILGSNEFSDSLLEVHQPLLVPLVSLSLMLEPSLLPHHLRKHRSLLPLNHTNLAPRFRLATMNLTRYLLFRENENQTS